MKTTEELKIGDQVSFKDKTGELLSGDVTELEFDGDPKIITVNCFKKSWDMEVSCLVQKKSVNKKGA